MSFMVRTSAIIFLKIRVFGEKESCMNALNLEKVLIDAQIFDAFCVNAPKEDNNKLW